MIDVLKAAANLSFEGFPLGFWDDVTLCLGVNQRRSPYSGLLRVGRTQRRRVVVFAGD